MGGVSARADVAQLRAEALPLAVDNVASAAAPRLIDPFAATTAAGTVRGIRVNEDSFFIQIKDARGQFHSFAKSELKDLKRLRGETPMPSFEGSLTAAELDDLVAYLASLKGKS